MATEDACEACGRRVAAHECACGAIVCSPCYRHHAAHDPRAPRKPVSVLDRHRAVMKSVTDRLAAFGPAPDAPTTPARQADDAHRLDVVTEGCDCPAEDDAAEWEVKP